MHVFLVFITMHACTIELNITGKLPSGKHTQTSLKPNFTSRHACLKVKSRNFACCRANYTRFSCVMTPLQGILKVCVEI